MAIDGFRIDTMKHVNDEFWQAFAPEVLDYAAPPGQARVLHVRRGVRHHEVVHVALHHARRGAGGDRLPVPGRRPELRRAAPRTRTACATSSPATTGTRTPTRTSTSCPTFLGNHDMGRIGLFIRQANAGATDAEVLARDRLAHELMYLSRGNPVIYYGDEQGFVGDGGDQLARQDMFPSQVAEYNDDDLIGTDATTAVSNFDTDAPAVPVDRRPVAAHAAPRGAARRRADTPLLVGDVRRLRVLAARSRAPARVRRRAQQLRERADGGRADLHVARLVRPRLRLGRARAEVGLRGPADHHGAAAVGGRVPRGRSRAAQQEGAGHLASAAGRPAPRPRRDRRRRGRQLVLRGHLPRPQGPRELALDRHRRQRALPRVRRRRRSPTGQRGSSTRPSSSTTRATSARAAPARSPSRSRRSRSPRRPTAPTCAAVVLVSADVVPEHADDVVVIERRIGSGPWTRIARDSSSPVYSAIDDISSAHDRYDDLRTARLLNGVVTSAVRTVNVVPAAADHGVRALPAAGRRLRAVPTGGACTCGVTPSGRTCSPHRLGAAVPADRHGRLRRGLRDPARSTTPRR